MKINEFIKNNLKVTNHSRDSLMNQMLTSTRLPKIVCVDGFEMSVQVGYSLYSEPKKVAKRYSAVEIGYPSDHEPLIEKYAESFYKEDEMDVTDYPYTIYENDKTNQLFFIGRWSIRGTDDLKKISLRTVQYVKMDNLQIFFSDHHAY